MRKLITAMLLILTLVVSLTACDSLKGVNFGVSLTGDGVSLSIGSPAWSSQMSGVSQWVNWLSQAPSDEVTQHIAGVTSWLKALAG